MNTTRMGFHFGFYDEEWDQILSAYKENSDQCWKCKNKPVKQFYSFNGNIIGVCCEDHSKGNHI
jgi:hypothetical protein